MHELWDGCRHWSEEQEQADENKMAIRLLTCRRKRCRRLRKCWAGGRKPPICLGRFDPTTAEQAATLRAILHHMLKRSLAEDEGDPEVARIAKEARETSKARRKTLAWERAKESVKRQDGTGGTQRPSW